MTNTNIIDPTDLNERITKLSALADRFAKTIGTNAKAEQARLALNGDVAIALGLFDPAASKRGGPWGRDRWFTTGRVSVNAFQALSYATSVDDAMTLIPEGWAVDQGTLYWPGQAAKVYLVETKLAPDGTFWTGSGCGKAEGHHEDCWASAFAAAALRAHVHNLSRLLP